MATTLDCEDTVAFVLIKAELGQAAEVAAGVSALMHEDEQGRPRGVRWADVITGPYDVIAAVRVGDNEELGRLVVDGIQKVPGIKNPGTVVMTGHYKGGEPQPLGDNGHP
jgi:DNA-binding Lrp family transcriptional regulator